MGRRFRPGLAVLVFFATLTVLMTWPQARHLSTHLPDTDDPLLSIWRISWIAHALPAHPSDLLNGNIFHPEKRTLILGLGTAMFRSTVHWQPILNGYSGFFPQSYLDLTERVKAFPDDASIEYLKTRGVDLIVLHGSLLAPDRFGALMAGLLARPDIRAVARYEERWVRTSFSAW